MNGRHPAVNCEEEDGKIVCSSGFNNTEKIVHVVGPYEQPSHNLVCPDNVDTNKAAHKEAHLRKMSTGSWSITSSPSTIAEGLMSEGCKKLSIDNDDSVTPRDGYVDDLEEAEELGVKDETIEENRDTIDDSAFQV